MRLNAPLKTTVEQTLHDMRSKRTRRRLRTQEFGMMLSSRVLRPAHIEVRQFRQAMNIPDGSPVSQSPQASSPPPTKPRIVKSQSSAQSVNGSARIAPILASMFSRLSLLLSPPRTRLRSAPLDRQAALSAARRSMARPLRPQPQARVLMPQINGLSAAIKTGEAMLRDWWYKFVAQPRNMTLQRRLLYRCR